MRCWRVLVGVNEVLPACGVVGGDDGGHRLGGVEGGLGVAIVVDGDAGESGGGAVGVQSAGCEQVLSDLSIGAIEAEAGVGGGLVGEIGRGSR